MSGNCNCLHPQPGGCHACMPSAGGWNLQATAETPRHAHACNCIGCCRLCGTCRTWHGHTAAYCELLQRQAGERAAYISAAVRMPVPREDSE